MSTFKPDMKPMILMFAIAILYAGGTLVEEAYTKTRYTPWLYGAALIILTWIGSRKIAVNSKFAANCLFAMGVVIASAVWHYEFSRSEILFFNSFTMKVHLVLLTITIVVTMPLILKAKNFSKYQILKMAALKVGDSKNGYTTRPYKAKKHNFSSSTLKNFAEFARKKKIAYIKESEESIVFALTVSNIGQPMTEENNFQDVTYVSYNNNGSTYVNVSKFDYNSYKKKLSFDQLCSAIDDVFRDLINDFKENRQQNIINKLKSMRSRLLLIFVILQTVLCVVGVGTYLVVSSR